MKHAVIRNMFRTVGEVCTGESELLESRNHAREIALSNGYSLSQHQRNHSKSMWNADKNSGREKLPLCISFISDKVSMAIKQCIARAQLQNEVILVNSPNDNLKKQLIRNRVYDVECISEPCIVCPYGKRGDCSKLGVVYQLECLSCNAVYIGETGRMLSIRVKEHMANKRKGNPGSPLGKHRIEEHRGDEFDVKCVILAFEADIAARKALEAAWIYTRKPSMNGKNECVSIASDLVSYLSLCEL